MIDSIPFKLAMNDSHSKHWLPIEFGVDILNFDDFLD